MSEKINMVDLAKKLVTPYQVSEKTKFDMEAALLVEDGLKKYKRLLEMLLVEQLENLYGGPREFKTKGIKSNEESYEFATEIWNEAVAACLEVVRGK